MKRRSFLGYIASLMTGASIVKVPDIGKVISLPEALPTGFLDLRSLKRLFLVTPRHKCHQESGIPEGWCLTDDAENYIPLGNAVEIAALTMKPTAVRFDEGSQIHHFEPGSAMFQYAVEHSIGPGRGWPKPGEPWYMYGASIALDIAKHGTVVTHALTLNAKRNIMGKLLSAGISYVPVRAILGHHEFDWDVGSGPKRTLIPVMSLV